MENLNKENFWDDIKERYPQAVELFCNWIDKYKEEVGWDRLFANGQYFMEPERNGGHRIDTKFHDLPFEMQNGILARFDIECFHGVLTGKGKAMYESQRGSYLSGFTSLFADLQKQLNKQNQ
jgi:hypothetical protein